MFHTIQYIGNKELLRREKTLFVCSKRAPWGTYERIFGWVESLTEKDVVVCCNTSELEVEVMKSLVVNQVPTILVVMNRFREENNVQIQKALKEGRMLVVVMKQMDRRRWSPRDRNEYLISKVADRIVGGYIDKYGSLFPLLSGKTNFEALTDNITSNIAAEPDNSYQRWTVGEDKILLRMFYEDYSIHEIKKRLNRTYLAVQKILQILTKFSHIIYFICIVMSVPIPKINRIFVGKIKYQFSISMKNFNICKMLSFLNIKALFNQTCKTTPINDFSDFFYCYNGIISIFHLSDFTP